MAKLNFSIALGLAANNFKQGLSAAQNQVKGFVNNVRSLISGMTGIMGTIGFVEFSRQMIEAGRNFQQSMSQVQAVSGASKEQFKAMSDEAKRLGSTTKYSASEAANALENLTRNGMSAEDATVALSKTLNLAAAGGLDLAQSADIATNTMNAFKLSADEAGRVADVFSYAAGHSATNVEMLGAAMTNVASIAKNNNISLEETTACLGALANVGIKGANAGTQLRMVMLGLSKPTANQAKAFKELGVNITEQDIKTKGLTANLQKLLDAGIMQKSNSNTLLAQIFGSKTVAASAALLTNLQSATNMMGDLETKAVGTASAMAKIQSDTLDGDIKALQSAWESFNIALFETKDGALRSIVQGLTDFVTFAKENIQALIGFIVMQLAGIKLTKMFASWIASSKATAAQLEATAQASTTKRLALEQRLSTQKIALLKLEAQQEEATAAKKKAIAAQVAAKKAEIANTEQAINAAKNAEIVAQDEAAAYKTASVWRKGMFMAKASFVGFMTTVKTLFRSFAPLLIFELLFTVGMKVYSMLSKNSKGFMSLAKVVGGAVNTAITLLAEGLAKIFDYVADLFGLVEKNGKKYRSKKTGKVYNSMEELNAAEGNKGKKGKKDTKIIPGSNDQYSSNQDLLDALGNAGKGGTKEKTPKEQAKEDVAKAEKDYSIAIKKAQEDTLNAADAQKNGLTAIKSLYDAYLEAYVTTGDEGYKAKMDALIPQIESVTLTVEAADDATKELKEKEKEAIEKVQKRIEAEQTMKTELADLDKQTAGGRDTTFDYRFTGKQSENLKLQADLEFDLDKAQKRLEILKKAAEDGCTEAINQIAEAEKKVDGLDKQLKLAEVQGDVIKLKEQLNDAFNFDTIQQGWGAIESTVNSINSMVEKLEDPDARGWEQFAAVMNTVMGVVQTFIGIYETLNTIMEISSALSATKSAATTAEGVAAGTSAAAMAAEEPVLIAHAAAAKTSAVATEQLAAAEIFAAHASIPFAGSGIAAAQVATMEATMASVKASSLALSTGGIVRGASPVGDFVPALLNSNEMVLNTTQQSRLFQLANGAGTANQGPINLRMKVRGRDLITCEDNEARISAISGRKVNH